MPNTAPMHESAFQFPWWRAMERVPREQKRVDALTAELQASLAREEVLLRDKQDLSQRQGMLAQEFEHRLLNFTESESHR